MEELIIATQNEHKMKEYKEYFKKYNVLSLNDIGFEGEIDETGDTFEENSLIKAKAVSEWLHKNGKDAPVIADDGGLCVDALGGAPGVYSARYAGNHDAKANRHKLLHELKGAKTRNAHYTDVLTKYYPDGHYVVGVGHTYGRITYKEYGDTSFGYDSIFYSYDLHKTFGKSTKQEKNKVSHRGRALVELLKNDSK